MSWQEAEMSPAKVLAEMQKGKAEIDALVGGLDEGTLDGPRMYGELTIKDVMAHLSGWVALEATWLEGSVKGEQIVRFAPGFELNEDKSNARELEDGLNAEIYRQNKDKPAREVVDGFHAAHDRLVRLVGGMSERDLMEPGRFEWWQDEPIWTSIAGNTYEHYREHAELIRQGLESARS
jgi:hypothetical protein